MLAEIPKASGARTDLTPIDSGVEKLRPKTEVIQGLGFTQKQAERIQTMAQHPEIVEQGSPTKTNHSIYSPRIGRQKPLFSVENTRQERIQ